MTRARLLSGMHGRVIAAAITVVAVGCDAHNPNSNLSPTDTSPLGQAVSAPTSSPSLPNELAPAANLGRPSGTTSADAATRQRLQERIAEAVAAWERALVERNGGALSGAFVGPALAGRLKILSEAKARQETVREHRLDGKVLSAEQQGAGRAVVVAEERWSVERRDARGIIVEHGERQFVRTYTLVRAAGENWVVEQTQP